MHWIQAILQSLAAFMIMPSIPTASDGVWTADKSWTLDGHTLVYKAESQKILSACRENPSGYLITPMVVQGGHQIFLDDKLILSTGDRSFRKAFSFYNTGILPCNRLSSGKTLRWEVFTATHSLAHLSRFPQVQRSMTWSPFFEETANIIGAGTLVAIGVICTIVFYGKVANDILSSLLLSSLFLSVAFGSFVPRAFLINAHPLTLQRISDTSIWLGLIFNARLFYFLGYTTRRLYQAIAFLCCIAIAIIACAGNLDQIQLGSNIAFIGALLFFFATLFNNRVLSFGSLRIRAKMLQLFAVLSFAGAGIHDTILFQGYIESQPILAIGVLFFTALLALAVNQLVVATYDERDYLRNNLEQEVERKTEALKKQSTELEQALTSLKNAQADLVQSAKLAALGTLSAGIAHEINNALNYVNGSIDPLQTLLKKPEMTEVDRSKAGKLLGLMKEGLNFTFAIITNLKKHTSTIVNDIEDLSASEAIDGVLLLLKSKLTGINVKIDIDSNLRLHTERVSFSQVFMNLVGNAIDAIEENPSSKKEIHIAGGEDENSTWLSLSDSGKGMTPEIQNRIFEPFFTTKAIGKGTGLGLHIVLSEMKKQGGRVELKSILNEGTQFTLHFPKKREAVAA